VVGAVEYQGTWDADTNTPTLTTTPSEKGLYYKVSVAGTFDSIDYEVGDWIISNGTSWEKVDNTDQVTSVFGRQGAVVAQAGDYDATEISNFDTEVSNNVDVAASKAKTDFISITQAVDLDAIESKVDGIEALADVTDADNVAAAGAVMQTEKDVVNGIPYLNALGNCMVKGEAITFAPEVGGEIRVWNRTDSEKLLYYLRNAANDYVAYLLQSGSYNEILTEANKDVANGVAALDASGYLLSPSHVLSMVRSATGDDIYIRDRTSNDLAFRLHRFGTTDFEAYVNDAGTWRRLLRENEIGTANGVAGISASGNLINPGSIIASYRGAGKTLQFYDLTDNNGVLKFERHDTLDWDAYVQNNGSYRRLLRKNEVGASGGVVAINADGNIDALNGRKLLFSADKYIYEDQNDGEAIKVRVHTAQARPSFIVEEENGTVVHELKASAGGGATFTGTVSVGGLNTNNGNITTDAGTITTNTLCTTSNGLGKNIKVGDNTYIGDVNRANAICIQGIQNGEAGEIYFGSGLDVRLYRKSANVLKTDGLFQCVGLDAGSQKITNVAEPTSAQDAATKAYVDANSGGATYFSDSMDGELYTTVRTLDVAPSAGTITLARAIITGSLPQGQSVKVDIRKNGTATTDSIFTSDTPMELTVSHTLTNNVYIATGTLDSAQISISQNDVLYAVVTQVGSTYAGSDLIVQVLML
jgi:hypothetical protein